MGTFHYKPMDQSKICTSPSMATHNKAPFFLQKKDVVLVKPAKPTPSDTLSLSTIDNDPNLELYCQTIYVYHQNSTEDCVALDSSLVLEESLSKVLVHYYPLAGKLNRQPNGRLQITCNADGVPFLCASANCSLSSLHYLEGIDVGTAKLLVIDSKTEGQNGYHPLVLQVTKFSCGGFTIGMGISHSVVDGHGAAQFFRAVTELASGKSEPTVKPLWERERLVGNANQEVPFNFSFEKDSLAKSPFLPTKDFLHQCFNIDGETIRRLKLSLLREIRETKYESFTTLETLGAYVWRSKFRALKQNSNGKVYFTLAMGIRHLLDPPLPNGYYGNAFVSSPHLVLMGRDLEGPLSKTVKMIKEIKKIASNKDYIRNSLDFLENLVSKNNVKIEGSGALMVLSDWRNLDLLGNEDFGWEAPVNMVRLPWNIFGYVDFCTFLPPCRMNSSMKGGVTVQVSLPIDAMGRFEKEMDALRHIKECSHI